jgi:hypothetical protein
VSGLTLDAGALISHERRSRTSELVVGRALRSGDGIAIPAGALAQVFRDGARQARLMRLLDDARTEIVPLDAAAARIIGRICAVSGTADVIDASVVLCARVRRHVVLTSDAGDLLRIDPSLRVVEV